VNSVPAARFADIVAPIVNAPRRGRLVALIVSIVVGTLFWAAVAVWLDGEGFGESLLPGFWLPAPVGTWTFLVFPWAARRWGPMRDVQRP
jgi:hypothetical protein